MLLYPLPANEYADTVNDFPYDCDTIGFVQMIYMKFCIKTVEASQTIEKPPKIIDNPYKEKTKKKRWSARHGPWFISDQLTIESKFQKNVYESVSWERIDNDGRQFQVIKIK